MTLTLGTLGGLGQEAQRCDERYCRLPNCFCGGSKIPNDLPKDKIPQFVLLTFDDAVNGLNQKFFEDLFKNRLNPNGCPIKVSQIGVTFLRRFSESNHDAMKVVNYESSF